MHPQAYEWVAKHATLSEVSVLDIGGRNINGTVRDLFPNAVLYVTVDLYEGPNVNVVGDVTEWETDETFDVVVCAEVLEHADNWREIVATAYHLCKPGGQFVMTCAGPGRPAHSGVDGEWRLHDGEHYGNVSHDDLEEALVKAGWESFTIDLAGEDLRCVAER